MSSRHNATLNGETLLQAPVRALPVSRDREVRMRPQRRVAALAPDQIWGHYNNYRANGVVVSVLVHCALLALLLSGIFVSHQITQRQTHQTVTLIAPSPETYTLPASKKVVSGGGGGGDHDVIPPPKGPPPKAALRQIAPPAIVIRNQKPRLAVQPTVVAPPTINVAENRMPNLGVASPTVMPAAPPSNGTGSGGGIGSGPLVGASA